MGEVGGEGNTLIHFSWRFAAAETTGKKTRRKSEEDKGEVFFFTLWPKNKSWLFFFAEPHLQGRNFSGFYLIVYFYLMSGTAAASRFFC